MHAFDMVEMSYREELYEGPVCERYQLLPERLHTLVSRHKLRETQWRDQTGTIYLELRRCSWLLRLAVELGKQPDRHARRFT